MMIEKWVDHTRTGDRLLLFGAGMVLLYWLLETYIDQLVGMGTFVSRLLPLTDINELWMRGAIVAHMVGFVAYAHSSVTKHRQTAEALRASEERLQAVVTREQEARQRAEEAHRLAEAAVRVRDDFLAAASHDLRTPLACIVSRVDMLQRRIERRQALPEAWLGEKVGALREAAGSMLSIVEGIIDAAHLQMGRTLTLQWGTVDLGALVCAVAHSINETSAWCAAAPVLVDTSASCVVWGDRARLERVLQNVIGNAVKYSPDGAPVQVAVRMQEGWDVVVVRDSGVGIPADELPHIFTHFYRASTARRFPGSGLGLAGAKTIVEQHGGHIRVQSAVGQGTTVVVSLPCALSGRTGEMESEPSRCV
jgi:signal transduction histidine kinase